MPSRIKPITWVFGVTRRRHFDPMVTPQLPSRELNRRLSTDCFDNRTSGWLT
jgi:hypothetical protein